jgi:2-polyprenyl-3-methyl-5-hydroxy-6-metoxy-1,4-benzoquinol methylase
MRTNILVRLVGWRATLVHGDTTTLDRWLWLRHKLPLSKRGESLIDIGCGTGSFTIGAALRGFKSLGLSWDQANQAVAAERARICRAKTARFEIVDVRVLNKRSDLLAKFDLAILCEVIEHIVDDHKLMRDAAACLKPRGRLLLTTPNVKYVPITLDDAGPFCSEETGWHVRKGYSEQDLRRLCHQAGLSVNAISYCTGFLSQKITWLHRKVSRSIHPIVAWVLVTPLRIFPPLFDAALGRFLNWPGYSICLEASKSSVPVQET